MRKFLKLGLTVCLCIAAAPSHADYKPMSTVVEEVARLHVNKCEACTRPGDTLDTLAREFRTDWLQLWGANGQIPNPQLINTTTVPFVRLGPLYRAAAGDRAAILAATYMVTPAALVDMNPDLDLTKPEGLVPDGAQVCLLPALTCAAAGA